MSTSLVYGLKFAKSAKQGEDATPLASGDWREVLISPHADDAHAWPYTVHDGPAIRQNAASPSPGTLCHFVFLDFDGSNDHPAILEAFQAVPVDHYLARFCCIYPTRSGMRFVYRLDEPLTPAEYGPATRGAALDLSRLTGLKVDPTTDQWHRCMRLPKVTRNDDKAKGPTWLEPYFFEPLVTDETVSPDELSRWNERLPWDQRGRTVEISTGDAPAFQILSSPRLGSYKKVLKTSRFREYIFEWASIPEGRRDQTLLAIAAEVVGKTFTGVPDSSVEEVYQLLCPITDNMRADGSEPWTTKLWRMVQHCWNAEAKKELDRKEKEAADLTQRDVLVAQMLKAIPPTLVPNDPAERRDFIQRHFCLQTPLGAYVIQKSGNYSRVPLKATQLPAHFNDGLHCLVDGGFRTEKGALLGKETILNNFSVNLDDVQYVPGDTARVELTLDNDKRILKVIPFALRQDLLEQAEFDQECGEWLATFHDGELLKRWLAAALALERGPVSSLYLSGPARVGKSMLALALAECFHCQPIPAAHAFSEFNGGLLQSPIIMIDEGLPTKLTGMDIADQFRSMVTGSAVSTQKKGQDQLTSYIHYRLVFTANSFDMVRKLIGKRTMDAQDRDAFRERILVVETGREPADYLDQRGARRFTADWITGKQRLVKHLLKLYQTMVLDSVFEADGRLLVEGRQHAAFTLSFDLSGAGRDIVDHLTNDISKLHKKEMANLNLIKCMEIEGTSVWVKKRPYTKFLCDRAPMRAEAYSVALDRFLTGQTKTSSKDMAQMARVDLPKLMFCAKAEGHDTSHLQALVVAAQGVA